MHLVVGKVSSIVCQMSLLSDSNFSISVLIDWHRVAQTGLVSVHILYMETTISSRVTGAGQCNSHPGEGHA